MKITTKSKFTCEINEDKAKDWRFVKALAKMESKNESDILAGTAFAVPFILGDEGEQKLIEHVTDENGIASTEQVITEFKEIMIKLGEATKKS